MYDANKSGNSRNLSNFLNYHPSLNISEDCFPDQDDDVFAIKSLSIVDKPIEKKPAIVHKEPIIPPTPVEKKEIKNVNLPKVDSFSKMSNLNKSRETPTIDKNQNIAPDKPLAPYDPSVLLDIYKQHRPNESTKPLINVITIGNAIYRDASPSFNAPIAPQATSTRARAR